MAAATVAAAAPASDATAHAASSARRRREENEISRASQGLAALNSIDYNSLIALALRSSSAGWQPRRWLLIRAGRYSALATFGARCIWHRYCCALPPLPASSRLASQVAGFPRVIGVLTHLDSFRNPATLRRVKKQLKQRFWTDIYEGCKLFYLSGIKHGRYPKAEVTNLGRFISVRRAERSRDYQPAASSQQPAAASRRPPAARHQMPPRWQSASTVPPLARLPPPAANDEHLLGPCYRIVD